MSFSKSKKSLPQWGGGREKTCHLGIRTLLFSSQFGWTAATGRENLSHLNLQHLEQRIVDLVSWFYDWFSLAVDKFAKFLVFILIRPNNNGNITYCVFTFLYRNIVYNISISDFTEQRRLIWHSPENDVKMCVMKGKDDVSSNLFWNSSQ